MRARLPPGQFAAYQREYRKKHTAKLTVSITRYRAKKAGIEFDISENDITIPAICPLLGIPIVVGGPLSQRNQSPSIDRIRPELGYVKGNVWVISFRANAMKLDATIEEIEMLAKNLRKKLEE